MAALKPLPQSTHMWINLRIICLTYWDFCDISPLHDGLGGLEILVNFSRLGKLQNGITKLNKLRLLDLSRCTIEADLPWSVCRKRFTAIEELYVFTIYFGRIYETHVLLRLGVSQSWIRIVSDTIPTHMITLNLCHFLKLLSVSACPYRVYVS